MSDLEAIRARHGEWEPYTKKHHFGVGTIEAVLDDAHNDRAWLLQRIAEIEAENLRLAEENVALRNYRDELQAQSKCLDCGVTKSQLNELRTERNEARCLAVRSVKREQQLRSKLRRLRMRGRHE